MAAQKVIKPEDIKEMWVLQASRGHAVPAMDDSQGNDLLAYASEAEAVAGAKHQNDMYDDLDCIPVRVFPK